MESLSKEISEKTTQTRTYARMQDPTIHANLKTQLISSTPMKQYTTNPETLLQH